MASLRILLLAMLIAILAFTFAAVTNEGINLVPQFFNPILARTWQGQFNVDFVSYLVLSGVWMAWRGGFTRASIALGLLAPPFGILFFAPYLIYLIGKTGADPKKLLLGVHAQPEVLKMEEKT
ncbi:MAG: hypothetical protein AAFN59_11320 [Pseudomonadota bacterium]